jgi:hypothetical protein
MFMDGAILGRVSTTHESKLRKEEAASKRNRAGGPEQGTCQICEE